MDKPISESADYIIIGGGLAGCTLAARLHEGNPSLSIIILEAGPDIKGNPLTIAPLACFAAHYSELDYAYHTIPQKQLDNRFCYQAGAKALSGGTAINYGTWTRGSAADYDDWAKQVGDDRWSYKSLLPYFRKVEHHFDLNGDPEAHGFHGPIHTASVTSSSPNRKYPLREPTLAAWSKLGHKFNPDGNNGYPLGISELVENWRDGKRQPAAQAYDLTGVQILTNTPAARVIIKDSSSGKVVTGVLLVDGRTISAKKEVIISAGTYRTPQILMLSGIGDPDELSKYGISTTVANRAVGANHCDHLAVYQFWKLRHPSRGLAMGTPLWTDPGFFVGLPVDWIVSSQVPQQELKNALEVDGDANDTYGILHPLRLHLETITAYVPAGAQLMGVNVPVDGTHMGTITSNFSPTSRGRITLSSANPLDAPVIDPNYNATATDRAILRYGVREVLKLFLSTPEMLEVVESEVPPEGYRPLGLESTDEEVDARVRQVAGTLYHAAGTAGMGMGDKGVVDVECRVKGVKGLRVCDASVLPVNVGAHLQVVVYAVAERVADFMLGQ